MKILYIGTIKETERLSNNDFPEQVKVLREGKKPLILDVSTINDQEALNALEEAKLLLRRALNTGTPDFLEKKISEFLNRYAG